MGVDTRRAACLSSAPHLNKGNERDEYPSARRSRDPVVGANRGGDDGEWTREPPDRTDASTASPTGTDEPTSRLRRRAPAIQGSADRSASSRSRRSPSAASPNEGGTAEGMAFRPGTKGHVRFCGRFSGKEPSHGHRRSAQPRPGETPRFHGRHHPAARHPLGRPRDADRRVPAARRRGSRATSSSPSRAASASAATRSSASGPRRLLQVRDGRAHLQTRPIEVDQYEPDLPIEVSAAADPLAAMRAFTPQRRVVPVDGMPRFTGGAVGALAYDAVAAFEPTVPLPEADPVGVPTAAFIESDLVLVFDHLTHTLSAIASLHTEAPDLEGRYAIAERAIFEALERTARPSAAEIAGAGLEPQRLGAGRRRRGQRGRHPREPPPRGVRGRGARREGRDRGRRGDPGRAGAPPVDRAPARRRRPAARRASSCTARSAGSIRARTCSTCGCRPSRWWARRPSSCSRSRATG